MNEPASSVCPKNDSRWRSTIPSGLLWLAFFGCIGLASWWLFRPTDYVADVTILAVRTGRPLRIGPNRALVVDDSVETHMSLLRSREVLAQAVNKRELHNLKTFEGTGDIVRAMHAMVSVGRPRDLEPVGWPNNLIEVRCRGPIADDCVKILSAIVESWQDTAELGERNVSDETLEALHKSREIALKSLTDAEKKLQDLHDGAARDGLKKSATIESRIAALERKAVDAELHRMDVKAQLAAAEANPESLRIKLRAREWATKVGYDFLPENDRKSTSVVAAYIEHLKDRLGQLDAEATNLEKLLSEQVALLRKSQTFESQEHHLCYVIGQNQQLCEATLKRLVESDFIRERTGPNVRMLSPPNVVRR